MIARIVGALGLLDVLLSVGGKSFVAPLSTAPQGQCCVSSLLGCRGRASWWAQTQVCGDDAVVVEGRRQSVDALPPSRRPVPLFGWLVFSISIFAGWPRWGASRPDGEKGSFEVKRRSSVSKKLLDLKGESPLVGTFGFKSLFLARLSKPHSAMSVPCKVQRPLHPNVFMLFFLHTFAEYR